MPIWFWVVGLQAIAVAAATAILTAASRGANLDSAAARETRARWFQSTRLSNSRC